MLAPCLLLSSLFASTGLAAEVQRSPTWRPAADSVWLGVAWGVAMATELGKDRLTRDEGRYPEGAVFDPDWPDDRWARAARLRAASDVLLYGGMIGGSVAPLAYARSERADIGIMTQTIGTTFMVTNLIKLAVGEERPYTRLDPAAMQVMDPELYADVVEQADPLQWTADSRMSMPSGHTSIFGAALVGTTTTLMGMYAPERGAWETSDRALWGGAYALSLAGTVGMGALRVRGGKHHLRDTVAGGALGVALGVGIPALHFTGAWTPEAEQATALRLGWSGSF